MPIAAAFVYCYGKEPAFKTAFTTEFFQAEKRCEENLLCNILDLTGPAEQPIRQCRNFGRVLFDNSLESRFVAPAELFDQKFIINYLSHGYNIRPAT
jgi:hypothetical protein